MYKDIIKLVSGDITKIPEVEAIVNAANTSLEMGGGVCGAIFRAAGSYLAKECKEIGGCNTGEAVITKGYNLPNKYIIHTVGPIIYRVVEDDDKELLASCYRNSLKLALENNLKSIAFCCISTGEFRFPNDLAAEIAVAEVRKFLRENPTADLKVVFNVFKDLDKKLYEELLG